MTLPALDPELAGRLEKLAPLCAPVLPEHVGAVRKGACRLRADDAALSRGGAIALIEHRCRPIAAADADIPLLLLRPAAMAGRSLPGLCYLHGGGLIAGDERTGLDLVLDWVTELGLAIVSVGYRLAPEHPHPAPVEDCHSALRWMDANRSLLGLDNSAMILAGTSAGGGLAAGAALLARDRGGPAISNLLLMAPMLDDAASFPSSTAFNGTVPWDARSNRTGWQALLGDMAGTAGVPPAAAPSRAEDLAGLPPCFLDVGGMETFRDETLDFGRRLAATGQSVELHLWAGAFHGFDLLAPESRVAKAARAARLDYLRRWLAARA